MINGFFVLFVGLKDQIKIKFMNFNNYRKVAHVCLWFGHRVALSRVVKKAYHQGFYSDAGGKINDGEDILSAALREVKEETGLQFIPTQLRFIDCFIYPERKIKSFLFEVKLSEFYFQNIQNTEPHKQSDWQLFTIQEALKLKLMPSVKHYLISLYNNDTRN